MRLIIFLQLLAFSKIANAYMPNSQDMFLALSLVIFWLIGLGKIVFSQLSIKNKVKSFLCLFSGITIIFFISFLFSKLGLDELSERGTTFANVIFFLFNFAAFIIAGRVLKNEDSN